MEIPKREGAPRHPHNIKEWRDGRQHTYQHGDAALMHILHSSICENGGRTSISEDKTPRFSRHKRSFLQSQRRLCLMRVPNPRPPEPHIFSFLIQLHHPLNSRVWMEKAKYELKKKFCFTSRPFCSLRTMEPPNSTCERRKIKKKKREKLIFIT